MNNTVFQIKKLLLCLIVLSCGVMPVLPMRQMLTLSARRLVKPSLATPNLIQMPTTRPLIATPVARRFAAPTHAPFSQGPQHTWSGSKQNYHNNTGQSDRSSTKKPYSSWWSKWSQWFSKKSVGKAAAAVAVATGTIAVTQDEVVITDKDFTVENITKHPEHKDALIAYAQENIKSADWIDKNFDALQQLFFLYPESVQLKELSLVPQVLSKLIERAWDYGHHQPSISFSVLKKLLKSHPGLDDTYIKMSLETKDFPLYRFSRIAENLPCTREYLLEYLTKGSSLLSKYTVYLTNNSDKLNSLSLKTQQGLWYGFHTHPAPIKTIIDTHKANFIERIKKNPHAIESEILQLVYQEMSSEDKKIVRDTMTNAKSIPDIVGHTITPAYSIPYSAFFPQCTKDNHGTSQTEQHFCQNTAVVTYQIHARRTTSLTPEACAALHAAYTKEKEEQAKGNYVFYHGQRWEWRFKSRMYKQFYNLLADTPVGSDYQFLRFGKDRTYDDDYICDALFMNGALFGNATNSGSSTFYYFITSQDCSGDRVTQFSPEWISAQFDLRDYYCKYYAEFDALEKMHKELYPGQGNLLLISVPQDKINTWTYPCHGNASHRSVEIKGQSSITTSKEVLDTLRTTPEIIRNSDEIEYAMPTTDEVLDPYAGPRIYDFNAADSEKSKKYNDAEAVLFARIRQDMQKNKMWDAHIKRDFLT